MYKIGDKIVHPMHGAGTIKKIEQHSILGSVQEYYALDVSCNGIDVMIPVGNCESIGVRPIVEEDKIDAVLHVLEEPSDTMPDNWNKRYRINMDKLKSGKIELVAQVVRNLMRADCIKKLSSGEKKIFNNALKVLQSEVMLVKGVSSDEAYRMIHDAVTSQDV